MNAPHDLGRDDLVDLLNRCWMTHDGMWFYHCLQAFGIETANRLNQAAIKSLAPMEIARMQKALGLEKRIETFQDLQDFFIPVSKLFIPDFMNAAMSFPRENVMHWVFQPGNCFAYKGIKRIGAIEHYECGVLYRLTCWFDSLGVACRVVPPVTGCLMHRDNACEGDFEFAF